MSEGDCFLCDVHAEPREDADELNIKSSKIDCRSPHLHYLDVNAILIMVYCKSLLRYREILSVRVV